MPTSVAGDHKRHARLKAQGCCYNCREPAVPGKVLCAACERANRERVRLTRREYVRLGLCPYCYGERPATPGKEACQPCRDERNRRYNERRRQRIAAGLCSKCGKPLDGEATMCRECCRRQVERDRRLYERQKQHGLCTMCGEPCDRPGKVLCSDCWEKQRPGRTARYREKQALRPECPHDWRYTARLEPGFRDGKVCVLWRQVCAVCRKIEQHTTYFDLERIAEVRSWGLGIRWRVSAELLEQAAEAPQVFDVPRPVLQTREV
jgi:hypothetical protein